MSAYVCVSVWGGVCMCVCVHVCVCMHVGVSMLVCVCVCVCVCTPIHLCNVLLCGLDTGLLGLQLCLPLIKL